MADTREIVIRLVAEESEENLSLSMGENQKSNQTTNLSKILHPISTMKSNFNRQNPILGMAVNIAYQNIKNGVAYSLNRSFSLTEDYMSEMVVNNVINTIGQITSLWGSVSAGALAGIGGGPIGAVVGATVGALGWLANAGMQSYQRYDQQQISLNEVNVQTTFQRVRLGLVDGGRGTEN
jgi:hypothetical protein